MGFVLHFVFSYTDLRDLDVILTILNYRTPKCDFADGLFGSYSWFSIISDFRRSIIEMFHRRYCRQGSSCFYCITKRLIICTKRSVRETYDTLSRQRKRCCVRFFDVSPHSAKTSLMLHDLWKKNETRFIDDDIVMKMLSESVTRVIN